MGTRDAGPKLFIPVRVGFLQVIDNMEQKIQRKNSVGLSSTGYRRKSGSVHRAQEKSYNSRRHPIQQIDIYNH